MKRKILEICAFSLQAAMNAERAGADRIELCCGAAEGGTTPGYALIKKTLETVSIPVFPIIRPRGGNFRYSEDEFDMMRHDVELCKQLGCKGVTFSILLADNSVDETRTSLLTELAFPMEVTFIRGFDIVPDPFKALNDIKISGCKRILTSGQALKAIDATSLLKQLIDEARDEIVIMPASGINTQNLQEIAANTGATEFHASARMLISNNDTLLNQFGFGQLIDCNSAEVTAMRAILENGVE
ncbi:MAG: copper homeostasis protein CutC [Cytophagaceae bacterium]|jgi:copper homeostasis protein|nr:copper homeostasis protein CutC [Cytophagaceae bacterium]